MTDKNLDDLCAEAEALIDTDFAGVSRYNGPGDIGRRLLPRLLAERKAWKEGRPMNEAPRDGTEILARVLG